MAIVIHVYLSSLISYESSSSRKPMYQEFKLTNDYVFNMVFTLIPNSNGIYYCKTW